MPQRGTRCIRNSRQRNVLRTLRENPGRKYQSSRIPSLRVSRFSPCVAGGRDPTRTFADFSESDTSPPRSFPTMLPPWLGAPPSKISWKGGGPLSLTRMQWRSRGFRDRPDPLEAATGRARNLGTDFTFHQGAKSRRCLLTADKQLLGSLWQLPSWLARWVDPCPQIQQILSSRPLKNPSLPLGPFSSTPPGSA